MLSLTVIRFQKIWGSRMRLIKNCWSKLLGRISMIMVKLIRKSWVKLCFQILRNEHSSTKSLTGEFSERYLERFSETKSWKGSKRLFWMHLYFSKPKFLSTSATQSFAFTFQMKTNKLRGWCLATISLGIRPCRGFNPNIRSLQKSRRVMWWSTTQRHKRTLRGRYS